MTEYAYSVAKALGADFVGRVELNIYNGGIGSINVVQLFKRATA